MWAKVRLCRISASSVVVFGTRSPQNLLQEPYPEGGESWKSRKPGRALSPWSSIQRWKQVSKLSYLIHPSN